MTLASQSHRLRHTLVRCSCLAAAVCLAIEIVTHPVMPPDPVRNHEVGEVLETEEWDYLVTRAEEVSSIPASRDGLMASGKYLLVYLHLTN